MSYPLQTDVRMDRPTLMLEEILAFKNVEYVQEEKLLKNEKIKKDIKQNQEKFKTYIQYTINICFFL